VLFLAECTCLFIFCSISVSNLVFPVCGKEMFSSLVPDPVPCMSRFLSHGDEEDMAGDDENPGVLTGSWDGAGPFVQLQELGSALKTVILGGAAGCEYYPVWLTAVGGIPLLVSALHRSWFCPVKWAFVVLLFFSSGKGISCA